MQLTLMRIGWSVRWAQAAVSLFSKTVEGRRLPAPR